MNWDQKWQRRIRRLPWLSVALGAGTLALYLVSLSPGVLGGDVGELQFVAPILSLAHPTGTPLYILLAKAWSLLPLGPGVAWRLNLMSAVAASLAVVVVYRLLLWRTGHTIPALAAALSLALGTVFWEQAIMADKYALNALLVALVLALALCWGQTRSPATLHGLALVYGLSLAHHRTMALFAPPLLAYVWFHEGRALWRDGLRLLRLLALVLAPLLLYLYLPWAEARDLPPGTWHPRTLAEWYSYLMDTGRIGYVRLDLASLADRLLFYAQALIEDFGWPGLALGLGGLVWQFRHRSADAAFLAASFGLQAFLVANHHVPRHWVYFLPSFLIFALWTGEALGAIWQTMERWRPAWQGARRLVPLVLALAMLAWPLVPLPQRYRPFRQAHLGAGVLDPWRQELKRGYMAERLGRAIALVAPGAVIGGDWEQVTPLWYYQQVEGWRPDVTIVYPLEALAEFVEGARPLYLTRNQPGLGEHWHPTSTGPLIRLRPEPTTDLPAEMAPLGRRLGDVHELVGYAYGPSDHVPAAVLPLTLYWRALQAPAHDYAVSLRVLDQAGETIFQVDNQHPVLGTYPTSLWTAGEVVGDYYEIQLAPDLPPGIYRWGVVVYRSLPAGGWENLEVDGGEAELAPGGTFRVLAP